ncbi:Cyclomaltodextrinase [Poriferisphaera corsica]|uniref:Cyclomaltodextrinase n=1 Tax=Poriferisphaera corsica TaxID=2528020 RepID=A0A517YVZ3_9BACT|nr:glycoside hydrolase family 13 protein [Poriferisphaera corsica]QDU34393.1 Cyclomaltodextrinase [Poriferisphaera corsica]
MSEPTTSPLNVDTPIQPDFSNRNDRELAPVLDVREQDWRCAPLVYHVYLDRFVPPKNLNDKISQGLYDSPRTLRKWTEYPTSKPVHDADGMRMHQHDFWGGDLQSLRTKLDYIQSLGTDILYLNPIFSAATNHKYDASDYFTISPEYGSREDLSQLINDIHNHNMKIMLDGVFNHMGFNSPYFKDAIENPNSEFRDWYLIDDKYEHGFRCWYNAKNLPELNLENPELRQLLWEDESSVVQSYIRDGIDGWRLDVAYDLGFNYIDEIREAARRANPQSCIVGEFWNYPSQWTDVQDGVMNFHARHIMFYLLQNRITGQQAARFLNQMYADIGMHAALRSWLILDNHDTARLRHDFPHEAKRQLAQIMQFTLPGAVCLYYGTELGMTGGGDPACRAPMRWDLLSDSNPIYDFTKQLIDLRQSRRALRVGEINFLDTERALAFRRYTDRIEEETFIFINPTSETITELVPHRSPKIAANIQLKDLLTGQRHQTHVGFIDIKLPPYSAAILTPDYPSPNTYNSLKRVH